MRIIGPTTEEEVVYSFAEAETPNPDRATAIRAIIARRGWFLTSLLRLEVKWSNATIAPSEVGPLRTTDIPVFQVLARNLQIGTIVEAIRKGTKVSPEYVSDVKRLKADFDKGRYRGRPILVAEFESGPFTILEGTHRLPAILWRSQDGESVPDPVPIYLGTTPRLGEWRFARR